jgi:electron transfer flavoprotein alpha subunit
MKILVYGELEDGKATDLTLQCLAKGVELAGQAEGELGCALIGDGVKDAADEIISYGADKLFLIEDERLSGYTTTPYRKALGEVIREYSPDVILLPASTLGDDLASAVATDLRSACVLDCTELQFRDGDIELSRIEFDGKVITKFSPAKRPVIATLKDGISEPAKFQSGRQGDVVPVEVTLTDEDLIAKVVRRDVARRTVDLKAARIIVAGGAGVGSKENFKLMEELAKVLGGEVGATRAAVDAGWTTHDRQIGQTGVTVKPDLYIACGISGAVQHRVGIMGAKRIVAINIDPNAPIFRFAHYKIVGDLTEVVPKLIKLAKEMR